jgi:hypothetical protein
LHCHPIRSRKNERLAWITDYLVERNFEPKAYKWKADGKQILEKIQRARKAMAKNNV